MPSRPPSHILLPCHSLDDFPVYHKGDEAASLLSSWTVLWHPQLLLATDALPAWHRIDTPPADVERRLILVPSVAYTQLPTGFAARVQEAGGKVIRGTGDREAVLKQALDFVEASTPVSPDLAADFFALGYCYLQVQLLTRHMRYSTKLDELHFSQLVLAAARAAMAEETSACRERLQRCFDLLAEERDHYYPIEIRLIDLVVLPPCDSPSPLDSLLASQHTTNPIASAETWRTWCEQGNASAYREAIASGRWSLIGGEDRERRTPLLSQESLLAAVRRGRALYQDLLGATPTVFGRRRFGLCWAYPQVLIKSGFRGAWHATLDDGRFPEGLHLKTRWEGSDRAVIDAFARVPQDASLPETFLKLAIKIGEMLDSDHAAAISFVRWPGPGLPWLEDLIRTSRYCGAIGRFVSLESFLGEHRDPGISDRFLVDQYKSPYLTQAVVKGQVDPIATGPLYWQASQAITAVSALATLADSVADQVDADPRCDALQQELDQAEEQSSALRAVVDAVEVEVERQAKRAASILTRGGKGEGHLLLNPTSAVRRVGLRLPANVPLPKVERPVYAADRDDDAVYIVVDIPAMGYVWIDGQGKAAPSNSGPALGEEYLLRNEFFEMTVDRHSGGIRSFHEYNVRGNRLSQQLAIRLSEGDSPYTTMQADEIRTTRLNRAIGEIQAIGRLCMPDGRDAARYRQTFRTWRGSRILEIDVHLELLDALRSEPWKSYTCQRLVWRDQAADLWRDQLQSRVAVGPRRLEAPQYVEIELDPKRTTLLTGGLTHHRRVETHHLDTLLQVRGEKTQDFRLALGLDLPASPTAAQHFLSPVPRIENVPCPAQGPVGYLFHLDARNVAVTRWSTVAGPSGRPSGYRVRLVETMGRSAKVSLTGFREAAAVRKLDFLGQVLDEGTINAGKAVVELVPHEFVEVEVTWAS